MRWLTPAWKTRPAQGEGGRLLLWGDELACGGHHAVAALLGAGMWGATTQWRPYWERAWGGHHAVAALLGAGMLGGVTFGLGCGNV
jgi:hypothetical protein